MVAALREEGEAARVEAEAAGWRILRGKKGAGGGGGHGGHARL